MASLVRMSLAVLASMRGADAAGGAINLLCFIPCLGACEASVLGTGQVYASQLCYGICISGCTLCFHGDSVVRVGDGANQSAVTATAVRDVKEGDIVETFDDQGSFHWTRVTKNEKISVPETFTELKLSNGSASFSMAVTNKHMVIKTVDNITEHLPTDAPHLDSFVTVQAQYVEVGDTMMTAGGLAHVVSTRQFHDTEKYQLATEHGTVNANDVWTSTTCDAYGERTLSDVMPLWRSHHSS